MPPRRGRVNRGPAAAAENRRAILRAAREMFARHGFRVPLSTVAREAGVGQGVLYRHFPTRLDLAFAVFEDNFAELEQIAAAPDPDTFGRLWEALVRMTIEQAAFIELLVDARRQAPDYDGERHLRELLDPVLTAAGAGGTAEPDLTADDVLLALRMCFGVAVTTARPDDVRPAVDRAVRLLPARLSAASTGAPGPGTGRPAA